MGHLRNQTLEKFKEAFEKALKGGDGFAAAANSCKQSFIKHFDEECADSVVEQGDWDTSKARSKLIRDLDEHIASVRAAKLAELACLYEEKLKDALAGPVEALLDTANNDTWPSIRKLLNLESKSAVTGFTSDLLGFDIDERTRGQMLSKLEDHARSVVEKKAKEEAGKVLIRMKDRFMTLFSHDSDSMPRVWTGNEDIKAITLVARSASLKMLSILAAVRLDEKPDPIDKTLTQTLLEGKGTGTSDPLASSSWEQVPAPRTLITPVQCKQLWRQFQMETEYTVSQAISAQEASRRGNSWMPPPWAIVALIVLGFNEFMTLLRNPFYIAFFFVLYLVGKALWVQMDVGTEFQHGLLPGVLSLSTRFLPTIMHMLRKLAEEGNMPEPPAPQNTHAGSNQHRADSSSSGVSSTDSSKEE